MNLSIPFCLPYLFFDFFTFVRSFKVLSFSLSLSFSGVEELQSSFTYLQKARMVFQGLLGFRV